MTPTRKPLPPELPRAIAAGFVGTPMLVLGVLLALGQLKPPLPMLGSSVMHVALIAVALVLTFIEVRGVIAFGRRLRDAGGH